LNEENAMPKRIKRTRLKGAKLPPNTICITRGTKYGNPYKVGEVNTDTGEVVTLEKCLEYFEFYLHRKYQGESLNEFLAPLRKADFIACFCSTDAKCHGDVYLKLLNQ
jgi:Domain of unknown function (DUF4326)